MTDETTPTIKRFTTKRKEMKVEIENDDGVIATYIIREMTTPEREEWLNTLQKRYQFDGNGNIIGLNDYMGMTEKLVIKTLFSEQGEPVTGSTIRKWSSSTVRALFIEAQRLNGLNEEGVSDIKKV